MKTEKVRFYTERNSFGVQAMIILMALSIAFRLIGCWGLWSDRSFAIAQIALPIGSALLLMVLVWLFGRRALWLSFIPVILGAVFFIIKSLGFESTVHTVLCILLYSAVIALYTGTVFGVIRTKWILVLLFGGQEKGKSFAQGLKAGLGGAFTTFLDTISCFGNVMSYIRLFAVGMGRG